MVHDVAAAVSFFCDQLGFGVDFVYGDGPGGPDHAGVSLGDWSGAMASLQLSRVPSEREIALLRLRPDTIGLRPQPSSPSSQPSSSWLSSIESAATFAASSSRLRAPTSGNTSNG